MAATTCAVAIGMLRAVFILRSLNAAKIECAMVTVKWKDRSIGNLSPAELREALQNAISEIHFARNATSSNDFFATVLISYVAGALTVLLALPLALYL
ncbi:MAG: hypothetical protein AAGD43_36920 [Pseudomonadota bacterium]